MVTAENEMKWDATEPNPRPVQLLRRRPHPQPRAEPTASGCAGTPCCGTQQQPRWAQSMSGTALRQAMMNHVTQVATHYRGKIHSWDVVNEAFADGGSGGRRDSNLQRTGNDWIEAAFRAARAADPGAKLCYNDYNTDGGSTPRSTGIYSMVQRLQGPRCADRLRRLPVPPDPTTRPVRLPDQPAALRRPRRRRADHRAGHRGSGSNQAIRLRRVTRACLAVTQLRRHHRVGHPRQRLVARLRHPVAVRPTPATRSPLTTRCWTR